MSNAMQSEQINELAAALAKAQGAMENAEKNRTNPHFKSKYADLAAILDAVRLPLSSNGLCHTQTMQISERCLILRTTLVHSSGQFMATEYPIALALAPQQMGAALTYGRRYSLAAIVGIAQDDDDGESVQHTGAPLKPTNGNARIGDEALSRVLDLIHQKEADIPKLCKYFNIKLNEENPVSSLQNITTDILPNVIAALEAKKDRADA